MMVATTSCSDDDGRDIFQGARFLTDGDTVYLWKDDPVQLCAVYGMGRDAFLAGTEWTTGDNSVFVVSHPFRTMRGDSCIAYATLESRTQEGCAQLKVKFTSQYGQYKGHTRTLTLNVVNLDMEKIHLEDLPQGAFAERIGKLLFYMMPVEAGLMYHVGYRWGIEVDTASWRSDWERRYRDSEDGITYEDYRAAFIRHYSQFMSDAWVEDFYIGQTVVTAELWEAVMGSNPSRFGQMFKKRPVERVSIEDCKAFCVKLSEMTGRRYRLPTNAEWEYAAAGGKWTHDYLYAGSNTFLDVAETKRSVKLPNPAYAVPIYNVTSYVSYEVKQHRPNELGLYDMTGNVHEWVSDTMLATYRVMRDSKRVGDDSLILSYTYRDYGRRVHGLVRNTSLMDTFSTKTQTQYVKSVGTDQIGFRLAVSAAEKKKD